MNTKTTALQASSRTVFLAIATGAFETCPVSGPNRGAAIGALKRKELIKGSNPSFELTATGKKLFAEMVPPVEQKPAKCAKSSLPVHRHNERTMGYVAAVREAFGGLGQYDDHAIGAVVWRVTTAERAIEKAREAFAL